MNLKGFSFKINSETVHFSTFPYLIDTSRSIKTDYEVNSVFPMVLFYIFAKI